nr:hypothetical protein [Tanacetum cinerariifolium]
MVRSTLSQTTLPKSFWDYALETAARILNMVPTRKVEKTPYEVWHGKAPKLSYLKVWGCEALVKRDTLTKPDKLEPRSIKCIFEEEDLEIDEPQNPESEKWLNAMNVEMQSMKDNKVWVLVELPPNGKTVGSKWIFKKKTDMDGNVHIYKARLVAKGFTQTPGIDYEETFSPVADKRAIRILIAIAAIPMLQSVKTYLGKCFAMKDLGEAAYILGIKIYRDRLKRLIGLCQSAYIEKILKRCSMENSKRKSIPMQEKLKLSKSQGASTPAKMKRMQNVPYASAVGSIMYAVRCTRPDTGYVFVLNGGAVDWKSAKQSIFATSSAEAEYIAAFDASKEAVW